MKWNQEIKLGKGMAEHGFDHGVEKGHDFMIENYERYRQISGYCLILATVIAGYLRSWDFVLFFGGMVHIHFVLGQLWHKLLNIEYFYVKKLDPTYGGLYKEKEVDVVDAPVRRVD